MAIYGATPYEWNMNEVDINYDSIGTNSAKFTVGDPVKFSSGKLAVAGTTDAVAGVYVNMPIENSQESTITRSLTNGLSSATLPSTNAGTLNAKPGYIPVDENKQFLMGCNANLTDDATDVGTYYKLSAGTSGTVQVDVTNSAQTTTSRVVMIKKVDPFNEGGNTGLQKAVVVFVRRPTWIDQ